MATKKVEVKSSEKPGGADSIRTALMKNARFRLEFIAMVSKLCREHGVAITDETLSELTVSIESELMQGPGVGID